MNAIDNFKSKTELQGDCWVWCGGYGKDGAIAWYKGRMRPAARVSLTLFRTEPTPCKPVHRTCGNSKCVNPEHLEATK